MTDVATLVTDASTTTDSTGTQADAGDDTTLVTSTDATSSDDTSTDGDKPTGDEPKADDAPQGAPETYEDFTMPEGVTLDPEVAGDLKVLAKELNLPQESAQKVADLGAKLAQKWGADLQKQVDDTSAAWVDAAKADKEIGGDKLAENLGLAKTTLDKFGTPELRTLLNTSRLGNNPEVIRLLSKVGRAISDDNRITGGSATQAPKSLAERMYPNLPKG